MEKDKVPISKAGEFLLDECRMVLPGIQALFGFQLVAVFNNRFNSVLTHAQQLIHYCSIALVATAVALVMAPAAYHRQTHINEVTEKFLVVASRLLLLSMGPLMMGISLDFYLIGVTIFENQALSVVCSVLLFFVFVALWFVLPRWRKGPT